MIKEQIQQMLDEYDAAVRVWIETDHESRGGDSIVMLDRWADKLRELNKDVP